MLGTGGWSAEACSSGTAAGAPINYRRDCRDRVGTVVAALVNYCRDRQKHSEISGSDILYKGSTVPTVIYEGPYNGPYTVPTVPTVICRGH